MSLRTRRTNDPAGRPRPPAVDDFAGLVTSLRRIRSMLGMDVVFVSEFLNGSRIFRYVDAATGASVIKIGDSGLLEDSYCQRVVDGRLPQVIPDAQTYPDQATLPTSHVVIGGHLSVPIVLRSGRVFGTLCCFAHAARPSLDEDDASALRAIADVIALGIDKNGQFVVPNWME